MYICSNNNKHYYKNNKEDGRKKNKEIQEKQRNGTRCTGYLHNQQRLQSNK